MPFRGRKEGMEWDDVFFVHGVINVFALLKINVILRSRSIYISQIHFLTLESITIHSA